jgi:hypothetical protein
LRATVLHDHLPLRCLSRSNRQPQSIAAPYGQNHESNNKLILAQSHKICNSAHRLIRQVRELAPSTHEKMEVNDDRILMVLWMRKEQREWSSRWGVQTYLKAGKTKKSVMLDDFCEEAGYCRRHAALCGEPHDAWTSPVSSGPDGSPPFLRELTRLF